MSIPSNPQALTLPQFWRWLKLHYNCILRAGDDGCMIYDQPYLHWHLLEEEEDLLVVQVIRGKDLIAELIIDQRQIMYVEAVPQEDNNVLFDLIGAVEDEPVSLVHFLLAHAYEDEGQDRHRWTH
jgi:hypothetical protein